MALPTPVNFRPSQPNAAAIVGAAPQKSNNAQDQGRFEQHLNDASTQDNQPSAADRRQAAIDANRRNNDKTTNAPSDSAASAQNNDNVTVTETADATPAQADAAATSDQTTSSQTETKAADGKSTTDKALQTEDAPTADTTTMLQATAGTDTVKTTSTTDTTTEATKKTTSADDAAKNDKSKTAGNNSDDLANLATAPVPTQTETRKPETKVTKAEPKAISAPLAPSESSLVAAAASVTPKSAPQMPADGQENPDANLTITAKDGLGHDTAAKMADKTEAKTNATQQTATQANAQTPNAAAASSTTQNFAKMISTATNGEVSPISASGNSSTSASALNDLQNVSTTQQGQNASTATVRVGTLPGQTTPTQIPAMTIALQVARNLQKGINQFDIRLDPAEMGKIDVRMQVNSDGNVAAHLVVERPETLDLLRRDATALQQALNNAGLQANADSLSFSLRDSNAGGQPQNFSGQTQGGSSLANLEQSTDDVSLSPIYNVNISARGGIDIRI